MLDSLLACPRCDNALTSDQGAYTCAGCRIDFPTIDGLPFLFAEPAASMSEWRARLHMEIQRLEHEQQRYSQALDIPNLNALTRQRLEHLHAAFTDHAQRLFELMRPLGTGSNSAEYETYLSLRTRLPGSQGLNTYYANVHRDWCWGDTENRACAEIVADMLGNEPGTLVVLGAGGSRLAYDLQQRCKPSLTVAVDFNPLLMMLAKRVIQGESLELWEFPLAPKSIEDCAVLRTLQAPEPVTQSFHCVIADVLRAPFRAESIDTILTPWISDILNEDFAVLSARINRLLKPGGRWINFGSLSFDPPNPAQQYCVEEIDLLLQQSGFAAADFREDQIPYMCSPASRHGRMETVVTFATRKENAAEPVPRYTALPDWLVKNSEPVPLLPSFKSQAISTRVHAFVMAMINGQRSIKDMAGLMEEQRLMSRDEAEPVIRQFLIKMYDQ